jgi:hypothetical protein
MVLFDAETQTNTAQAKQNCSDIIAKGARLLGKPAQPVPILRSRREPPVPATKSSLQEDTTATRHDTDPINNASTWLELENALRKAQGKGPIVMQRAPRGATDTFEMAM